MIAIYSRSGKHWTREEYDYLIESVGQGLLLKTISKNLKRTEIAIVNKLEENGLSNKHFHAGTLSANMLATYLNVSSRYIGKQIRENGLPARRYHFNGNRSKNQAFHLGVGR